MISFLLASMVIVFALLANFRVLCVSSACVDAGVMVHTTAMRAPLPESEFDSIRVSFESRNGICWAPPSDSLWITVPSVSKLLLMNDPSTRWFLFTSALALSLPARSTMMRVDTVRAADALSLRNSGRSDASMVTLITVCDLDDPSLNAVAPIFLCSFPMAITSRASSILPIGSSLRFSTYTSRLFFVFSLSRRLVLVGSSRSFTTSL
mmetsp:Transcript_2058/g.6663  ORF Transcript_2058/g.6663 Transcript_2058/m.6663 type:complete len:208 (-) Transcript_2058:523-1146(-)